MKVSESIFWMRKGCWGGRRRQVTVSPPGVGSTTLISPDTVFLLARVGLVTVEWVVWR